MNRTPPGNGPLARVFWLPLATLVAVEMYARGFEGWGAWATAPLFLLPFVLGLAIAGAGAYGTVSELRSGGAPRSTLLRTAVAAAPVLWILTRRFWVD